MLSEDTEERGILTMKGMAEVFFTMAGQVSVAPCRNPQTPLLEETAMQQQSSTQSC